MKTYSRRLGGMPMGYLLPLVAVWAGCATPTVVEKTPAMSEARGTEKEEGSSGDGPAPSAQLPPALASTPLVAAKPAKRPVAGRALPTDVLSDLELTDEADVATVLRTLAKAAGVNMMISPRVAGTVSFAFKDIPWDQAFRSVVMTAGLTYAWEGEVLRVMTIEDMKRDLEMETVLKQREDVKAGKRLVEPMAIQVIPVKYSKARTVGLTVKALLADNVDKGASAEFSSRASVSIDEENNAIVVHAIPQDIEKAVALVEQLDRAKPQVHIEARIVEASRDAARQLGVQWGLTMAKISGDRLITTGGDEATARGYNSDFPAQLETSAGFAMGLISEKIGTSELLNMQLTALQRKGRIQILSSPSITTLDNEPAIIESGEERAYQKSTGTGSGTDISIEWKKAVLKLEVIPHIVDGEFLRVEISANKDSFDETNPETTTGELPVNTKHASTTVLLRNGETVVIGGLSQESSSRSDSGIPILMDIPGIGVLFKSKSQAKQWDETLIFITPKIIGSQM